MPLDPKTRLGPYEITALLGAGGMGEVYKARDTRLDRTVAIKICTGGFSERFEREARAIASLNHQHICALYDIGREGPLQFLVMEHLEGESLEARLRRGPLAIEEALRIAIQIAGALDAAHRKGITHRDLKPANVMLTRSGAKLLDFGLAKLTPVVEVSGTETTQLTNNPPITEKGTILGTFQYMSPEQLEGQETDTRSDIFSFGAMLFEMITGRKSFEASSRASLIAAVISVSPPPVSSIQPMASPALDRLVQRSLAKSPDDRWQSAADLRSELEWIAGAGSMAGVPAPIAARRVNRERLAWLGAGLAAALLLALSVWVEVHLRHEPAPAAEVHFEIPAPDKLSFFPSQVPAVSPDGQRIAFTASSGVAIEGESGITGQRLFVRPLNAATATEIPVPGSSPLFPFWSPDGRQIAFRSKQVLQKVDLTEGSPFTICTCPNAAGGTWNRDGVILSGNLFGALYQVPAAGGDPKAARPLAAGESAQMWPQFLPDGMHYLYLSQGVQPDQQGIYAASLGSTDRKFIVATDTNAAYLESGQLLFTRGDTLMAQPFDLRNLTLTGEPRSVTDHIELSNILFTGTETFGNASFSASPNGVMVWRRNLQSSQSTQSQLQWLDRSGKKLSIVGEPANYTQPNLSPDDGKLAVSIRDPQTKTRDIWIFDLKRGTKIRLTFDPADDFNPVWSPDGTRIAFTSDRAGQRDIYVKPADGSGQEELLLGEKGTAKHAEDWSRDGKYFLYNYTVPNPSHLYVLPLTGDRKPVSFADINLHTSEGQFSPNGRYVAYRLLQSGMQQVYVQGFWLDPSQPRGTWQVSTAGGELPRWRNDGKELYYHFGDGFYAVDVKTDGKSFDFGSPRLLFDVPTVKSSANGGSPFVVTRDGQRFLVLEQIQSAVSEPMEVVVNWR